MEVKQKVEEEQGKNYPANDLLIIHKGKVLQDTDTLASHEIVESSFLVLMVKKSPKPAENSSTTEKEINSGKTENTECVSKQPDSVSDSSTEKSIAQLVEMGFPRDQVLLAMNAAFNNADRAVEYLTSGLPIGVNAPLESAPVEGDVNNDSSIGTTSVLSTLNTTPLNMFSGASQNTRSSINNGLDFLRNNPQFSALRQVVQQNPSILQPMLQELSRTNPNLIQMIHNNQADFLQMVSDNEDSNSLSPGSDIRNLSTELDNNDSIEIHLTEAEASIVERLESMGFERSLVIEAFLACDRNEELAVNYLLEHSGEDNM